MSILNVNTIQPIGSGTTVTVAATELKTSNFITVGTGASVTSPSANVLTLGTNTAERLRITSAGYLGLGTNNPSYLIDAHTSSGNAQLRVKSGGDLSQLILESTDTSGYSQINFADAGSNNIGMLQYFHSDNHMEFTVNGAERLRIDSGGRIAQGGRTPTNHGSPNLLLWGADPTLHISATGSTANTSFAGIKFAVAGGSTGDYSKAGIFVQRQDSYNDLDMIFAFRSSNDATGVSVSDEKIRINSDGFVGINTDNPSNLLHIDGGTDQLKLSDGSGSFEFRAGNVLMIKDNGTERLRIFNDGSVRIGDSSIAVAAVGSGPTLGINGSAPEITLRDSATNNPYAVMRTNDYGSLYLGADQGNNHSSSAIHFHVDNSEKMRITGSGHVLRPTMAAAVCTTTGATTLGTFNTSYQTIAVNVEGYDNANNFNTSNYRFTAPETGFYQVGCNVQLENASGSNTNNWMYFYPLINGSDPATSTGGNAADFDPTVTHYYNWTYTTLLKLSQNDYVEWKYRGNLSAVSLKGGAESTYYFYQVG